jgi:tetratricopeptide (TPR) repeat protein
MKQGYFDKGFAILFILFCMHIGMVIINAFDRTFLDTFYSILTAVFFYVILLVILTFIYKNKSGSGLGSSSNGYLIDGGRFNTIYEMYKKMADKFKNQGQYSKAAFIHLKLLKEPETAALILEEGKQYNNAANLYLNVCKDKTNAARCYEKCNQINKAIEIHKELNNFEKVGDLYCMINKKEEGKNFYMKQIEIYENNSQFVKMALLYRNKLSDKNTAQLSLLKGWNSNHDAYNCLNLYFENIEDEKVLNEEIEAIAENNISSSNIQMFIQVLKVEQNKSQETKKVVRKIAYHLISAYYDKNKTLMNELQFFNKHNSEILSDIQRFKIFNEKNHNIKK